MEYPGRLEITTRIGCRCMCRYCPQELLVSSYFGRKQKQKPDRVMTMDTFRTCIDRLPAGTRIDFSGMAEPWLNPDCTKMVLYAAKKGFPIAVYTTLEGMGQKDFERIRDLTCEEFVVHIPDDQGNARIQVTEEYLALLEQAMAYEQPDGRKLLSGISCHAGIHPAILDRIPKGSKLITEIHDRAGNVKNLSADSKISRGEVMCLNCGKSLDHNVLLPDGTVLLCCMDYGMKHVLGNLLQQTYEEIHHSEEVKEIRTGMLDEHSDILCRSCVNARNIEEIYDEYRLFLDWTKKLQVSDAAYQKDMAVYKNWVKNLEKQKEDTEKEYKNWVEKLENQVDGMRDEFRNLENEKGKTDQIYKDWVEKLQSQIEDMQKEIRKKEKFITEQENKAKALKDQNDHLSGELQTAKQEIITAEEMVKQLQEQNNCLLKKYSELEKEWDCLSRSPFYRLAEKTKKMR